MLRQLIATSLTAAALAITASPLHAQSQMILTLDDDDSAATVGAGVFLAGPADVNQRPACDDIGVPCLTPRTFGDVGAAMFGTRYLSDNVGIAGEASVYGNSWYSYGTSCPPAGNSTPARCPFHESNAVRAALLGVEVRTHLIKDSSTRWRLFGRALTGPQWSEVGPVRRAVQVGAGADDYLRSGLVLHVQYDYRYAPDDRRDLSTGRFMIGLGIPIGTR